MSKEKFEVLNFETFERRQSIGPSTSSSTTSSTSTTTSSSTTSTTSTTRPPTGPPTTRGSTTSTSSTGTVNSSSSVSTTSSTSTSISTVTTIPVPTNTPSTSTKFVTESVTSNTLDIPTTFNTLGPTATPTHSAATGFFHDTGAVAGTFTAVGIVALILAVLFATTCIRRRRAKQFDADVAAAAAAAYRDADGYWEREDSNWNSNAAPVSSGYTSSAYTDGTHGAYNEPAMSIAQGDYQNYGDSGGYSAANNGAGGYSAAGNNGGGYSAGGGNGGGYSPAGGNGGGYSAAGGNGGGYSAAGGNGGGYSAGGGNGGGYSAANNFNGGYQSGGGYAVGGEAYGMNNLAPNGGPGIVPGALVAGAAGLGAGVYAAQRNRQRSPPPVQPNELYQGYSDMGMNDSLDGGRYPVPPVRSRSFNQGPQGGPGVGRSPSNSSSGHGHVGYPYPYPQNGGSPPSVNRSGSKGPAQGYSQNYGAPLPQMQEHHNEGDAYDGLSPESDQNGQHEVDAYAEVEEMPRVLRVANE